MKLEINVSEEDIRAAIERKVRVAIADKSGNLGVDRFVENKVASMWQTVVVETIRNQLINSAYIKEMIDKEVQRQVRLRVNKALKG